MLRRNEFWMLIWESVYSKQRPFSVVEEDDGLISVAGAKNTVRVKWWDDLSI